MPLLPIVSISLLLTSSVLLADGSDPTITPHPSKIRRQEVDLNKSQNEEVLRMTVEELSKGVPQKIDHYTTLVKVDSEALTLVYHYEIDTGAKRDEAVRAEDHARMHKAVTQGTCTTSRRFLESGISLSYRYNIAHSKARLFVIDVSKKDCPTL